MNSLNHLSDDWPIREVHSEDPYNSLWRELLHFGGRVAATRAMQQAPDKSQYDHFRNAIKLADAYWINFEEADEEVDAVPLYYGALWLGMACSYASLSPDALTGIESKHGLTIKLGDEPYPLLSSTINVSHEGTFSRINAAFGGMDFSGQVRVEELMSALPPLMDDLGKVGRSTTAIGVEPPGWLGYSLEPNIYPDKISVVSVNATFPINAGSIRDHAAVGSYLATRDLTYDSVNKQARWTGRRERLDEIEQLSIRTPFGLFLLPTIRAHAFPEFSIYLMVLYALSILVRYNPHTWIPMLEDQTDEHFLIRSFLLAAKSQVPLLAINHLTRKSWVFGTGGS
jgi:hypothetical protein